MSSSKVAGIRENIRILLALLTDCGCPYIPSESFRQAKYDKPEAVKPLWKMVQHVLCVLDFLKSGNMQDVREHTATSSYEEMKMVILHVRKRALELNYHRLDFYVDSVGSCELLLFFAWLLQATSFISQLQSYHLKAAISTMSISLSSSKHFLLDQVVRNTASVDREIQTLALDTRTMCQDDALRKIQWLKGTLQGTGRSIGNAHRAAVKLTHTILQSCADSTSPSRRQPLSLHEFFLLRYPEQLSACEKRLEWHTTSLHNLLKWQQHEPIFWQWMESVLDQHTASVDTNTSDKTQDTGPSMIKELCMEKLSKEVAKCQQTFSQKVADKIHTLHSLQRIWKGKEKPECQQNQCPQLPQVAIESGVLCPTQSSTASLQYSTVESELSQLQANIEEIEEHLHSLMSTVAEYIQ